MNDINAILEHGLDALIPSLNTYLPDITSRIIETESEQCIIPAGQAGYEDIVRFLEQRGELLARYDSMYMAAARIQGGFLTMNPALVICSLTGEQREQGAQVWVSVYAKEGLIKQHTAEKLIMRICDEFRREFGSMMLEIPEYKQKYEELMDAMVEAIKQSEIIFDYIPEHLDDLQNMVKNGLGREGGFLQKLNVNKLVEMLKICTSDQMYSFRSILRDVYPLQDNLSCNEEEKKLLLEFYKSILQLKNGFDAWDNIQRLNIDYLCSRLIQYLSAMGVEVESGSVG